MDLGPGEFHRWCGLGVVVAWATGARIGLDGGSGPGWAVGALVGWVGDAVGVPQESG